jgi:transposase
MPSPCQIALSGDEQAVLMTRARSVRGSCRDRLRAAIVLAAAAGQANAAIARELGVCTDTVRKWRRRFAEGRLAGLTDAPRSGRPPVFTAADRAEVVALACALPAESGVPLSRWSGPDLARELSARCQLAVSASTIRRWLTRDALKPWQHRSWISVRDPQFTARAAPVLDLYAGTWDGLHGDPHWSAVRLRMPGARGHLMSGLWALMRLPDSPNSQPNPTQSKLV